MSETRTIGIFGAGWVGLVTGGCFAELGHRVVVRDVVPERIESLRAGKLPFHERDLPELLERNVDRIQYTLDADDLSEADVLFICVQTPPTYSGDADLSYVWTALDDLPRRDERQVLVMKSTVASEKPRSSMAKAMLFGRRPSSNVANRLHISSSSSASRSGLCAIRSLGTTLLLGRTAL